MSGPRIRFADVSLTLGGQAILSGVSFTVPAGSIHCIVGPNGGGKTTLVRCLLGQLPHAGSIVIEGAGGATIGYAPQFLEIDRTLPLTVSDLLATMDQRRPAFWNRAPRNKAAHAAALARVGLAEKAGRLFGHLSGGERQRLLFAQALVPMPGLLIMDEPTANMDGAGTALVVEIVRDLARNGVTVLWVNHDWEQVRSVADGVTGINGSVMFTGAPDVVLPRGVAA